MTYQNEKKLIFIIYNYNAHNENGKWTNLKELVSIFGNDNAIFRESEIKY